MPAIHFGYGHQRDWQPFNVDAGSTDPNYYEAYGTQKVVFDGPNRLIIVDENVTELDIREDVYESWKEWLLNPDLVNRTWAAAIRGTGGDPISGTTDQFTGDVYFLINNWRLVYDPRRVAVTGVLYSDDFATAYYFDEPFKYDTPEFLDPVFPARVSAIVNTYEVRAALSGDDVASSVWNAASSDYITVNTMGALQNEIANIRAAAGATPAEIVSYMDANSTSLANITTVTSNTNTIVANIDTNVTALANSVSTVNSAVLAVDSNLTALTNTVNNIDTNVNDVETIVNSIDSELNLVAADVTNIENIVGSIDTTVNQINANVENIANILNSGGNGLTVQQATQLRELYEVFGLDPSKPLVVTLDARTAGANISQSIATTASQTTVTRIP
jgi:archaellum component FlaC